MISYKKDEFLLVIKEEMWKFYKNSHNEICYKILRKEGENEEFILIKGCHKLLSVILSTKGIIYILAITQSKSLVFYTYSEVGILENKLMNFSFDMDYIQVTSLNNSLNLVYTKYDNSSYCLYHRIIDSNLHITAPVLIDRIENTSDFPFISSVYNDNLLVLYVKKSQDYYLGYRSFSPSKYSWSSFMTLDKSPLLPYDYSFVVGENNLAALSYSIKDTSNSFLRYGIIIDNVFKGKTLRTRESISTYSYLIYEKNHFYLTYTFRNKLFMNHLSSSGDLISLDSLPFSEETKLDKYILQSDRLSLCITSGFLLYDEDRLVFSICSQVQKLNLDAHKDGSSIRKVDTTAYYEKQLIEKERSINQLNSQIKTLQGDLSQFEQNKSLGDSKETEIRLLKQDLMKQNSLAAQNYESKIATYKITLRNLETTLEDKNAIISNLKSELSELKERLSDNRKVIDSLTLNNKESFDRITALQETNESVSSLRLQLIDKDSTISSLRFDIKTLQAQLADLNSKNSKGLLKKLFE